MDIQYRQNQNPRVIAIQKIYGNLFNNDEILTFPKHRFRKFIKDIVKGTIERDDLIIEELDKTLKGELVMSHLDKLFQVIIKCAVFELLYKPETSTKIIIKEYLTASNSFLEDSQTKYLNALLDKISKKIRSSDEWIWINKKLFSKTFKK